MTWIYVFKIILLGLLVVVPAYIIFTKDKQLKLGKLRVDNKIFVTLLSVIICIIIMILTKIQL